MMILHVLTCYICICKYDVNDLDSFDRTGPMINIVPKDMYGILHIWVKLLNHSHDTCLNEHN